MKNIKNWIINSNFDNFILPKGFSIDKDNHIRYENDGGSPWFNWNEPIDPNKIIRDNRAKCSCGSKMVLKPEEDDWTFHSDYCDIYQNKLDVRIKNENIKK